MQAPNHEFVIEQCYVEGGAILGVVCYSFCDLISFHKVLFGSEYHGRNWVIFTDLESIIVLLLMCCQTVQSVLGKFVLSTMQRCMNVLYMYNYNSKQL